MKRVDYRFDSIIRVLLIVAVICGIIWKFSSNEIIIYITERLGTISLVCGLATDILKDDIKDHLLQKEGWV